MTLTAPENAPNAVDQAINTRQSTRAFLPTPVPRALISHLLQLASRAPSGTNTQPWKVYVLQGQSRDSLVDKVCTAHDAIRANQRAATQAQVFTMDKVMGRGSLVDYGMFLQTIMLAARGHGLHTCPQAAWNGFAKIILPHIGAGPDEMLVCGMALGYADGAALVNTFRTPRVSAADFTSWLD